jgi:peptidoglycan-N-acetylglucosamine deacetylase
MKLKSLISVLTGHRIRYHGPARDKRLYLTFDDGPHAVHTRPLLDLLAQHKVKATFFVVGREAHAEPDAVRRIVAEGHALGNHTITHPRMDLLSDAARDLEIDGMDAYLCEFDRRPVHAFRPPYGGVSLSLFAYALQPGRNVALWSRDSMDFKHPAPQVVEDFARRPPQAGDIILFHDDGAAACEALSTLLPKWLGEGFKFGTFADMAPA